MKLWSGSLQGVDSAQVSDGSTVLQKLYLCGLKSELLLVIDFGKVAGVMRFTVPLRPFRIHGGRGWPPEAASCRLSVAEKQLIRKELREWMRKHG